MYGGKTVAVVVPAYNEEAFIGDVIETVPAFVDHVYVVDDCSTDGTWAAITRTLATLCETTTTKTVQSDADDGLVEVDANGSSVRTDRASRSADLDAAGESVEMNTDGGAIEIVDGASERPEWGSHPIRRRITAIRHETNTGVGGAIKTGYRRALADDIDVTAIMAGDGQMDPAILDEIIKPVVFGEAEYAKGNRLRYAEYRRDMSDWRTSGNYLLTYLTRIASGYWGMMDPQNGYTAISKTALETIDVETTYDDYGFCNHLLVRLNGHGLRIADVPMRAVYGNESSHIRYSRFIPSLSLLLLRSYLGRLLGREGSGGIQPQALFQLVGMLLLLCGVGLGIGSLLTGVTTGIVGGGVTLLAGAGLFSTGIIAERRQNAALEVRIDPTAPPWDPGAEPEGPNPPEDAPQGGS